MEKCEQHAILEEKISQLQTSINKLEAKIDKLIYALVVSGLGSGALAATMF